jgi:hypothetical protein
LHFVLQKIPTGSLHVTDEVQRNSRAKRAGLWCGALSWRSLLAMGSHQFALWLPLFLFTGCGAKTGLLVPDVTLSEDHLDVPDVTDLPDVCLGTPLPVERFAAEVIFAIDRSGSMAERTPSGTTRWNALTTALQRVLPGFDRELSMGLIQFPGTITMADQCGNNTRLDLAPRIANSRNILASLARTTPIGGTPTFDALQTAARYYRSTPSTGRIRGRYIVLATDGGPNCNGTLSPQTCVCTSPRGCLGFRGNFSCLDDVRTVGLLRDVVSEGVATFVIGVPSEPGLEVTLGQLAIAGGRPRMAARTYYPAEDTDQFASAFRQITTALVRCRYVTNPVEDSSRVSVRVGMRDVLQDPSHTEGWDWINPQTGEFLLYGTACEATQQANNFVALRYGCVE